MFSIHVACRTKQQNFLVTVFLARSTVLGSCSALLSKFLEYAGNGVYILKASLVVYDAKKLTDSSDGGVSCLKISVANSLADFVSVKVTS